MSIVDEAVSRILNMVAVPKNDESRGSELIEIPLESLASIERMEPSLEEIIEKGEELLGIYQRIQSPGKITLFWKNIGSLYWQTLLRLYHPRFLTSFKDLDRLAYLTVWKTYYHEIFHHFCDICQLFWGGNYNFLQEEPLAVASSYHWLQDCFNDGRTYLSQLHPNIRDEFVKRIYNFSGKGYRDWVNFRSPDEFKAGCKNYLGPHSTGLLDQSGVKVDKILMAIREATSDSELEKILIP